MPDLRIRARGWVFTINNYTDADIENLQTIDSSYCIWGKEVGITGTRHLQGYIHFKNPRDRRAVARLIPRAFLEVRKGTPQQAIDYCKKDGLFTETGVPPKPKDTSAANEAFQNIIAKAEAADFDWIKTHHPKIYLHRYATLRSLAKPTSTILASLENEWWVGKTGTGKSKTAWELYPDHFQKQLNKWWDGYEYEDTVIIEEWSPKNEISGSNLKIWADRYPFSAQIKGGTLTKIRPKKLIVLSNYTIQECFPNEQDREPLLRRFTQLTFPDDLETVQQRGWLYNMTKDF